MRTFGEIKKAAYNCSSRSQEDRSATDEELLNVLNSRIARAFTEGHAINPWAFLAQVAVKSNGQVWARPTDAAVVLRIEQNDEPKEVAVVPFDQQNIERGLPSVYRMGNQYWPVLRNPRLSGSLNFWYAKAPTAMPSGPKAEIDPLYPHGHERRLVLELAIYMANKDGRAEDAALLKQELEMEVQRFVQALKLADPTARRLGSLY